MKPGERSPAHRADFFAELVCSNSLRSNRVTSAVGLLKEEMRRLGSLVIAAADEAAAPAGPGPRPRRIRAADPRDARVAPAHRGASGAHRPDPGRSPGGARDGPAHRRRTRAG